MRQIGRAGSSVEVGSLLRRPEHLGQLAEVRDQVDGPGGQLEAVLRAFAHISRRPRGHHGAELSVFLHRDERVVRAQQQLHGVIRDLLTEGARTGVFRDDIAPDELATYCLHALTAAPPCPPKRRSTGSSR